MKEYFDGKVALVTGAGSGIGLATARAFAEAGAAVALADVDGNAVRSAAEALVSTGHQAIAVRCNVAAEAEVAAIAYFTPKRFMATFGVRESKKKIPFADKKAETQNPWCDARIFGLSHCACSLLCSATAGITKSGQEPPKLPLISPESCHPFQGKGATDFIPKLPPPAGG